MLYIPATMALSKNYKIILLALSVFSLFCTQSISALEWENYTSFAEVRNLRTIDDTLYIATAGGLIVVSANDAEPKALQKLDGLGTSNISDIIKDADGDKWISGFGRLIKWSDNSFEQFLFFDNINNELFQLHTLKDDNNIIWIGSSLGLVLFSKVNDGGQIEDSYTLFGDLNPNSSVNDILLRNDTIWIATSDGVAFANYSNPSLLKSPSNWTTISNRNFAVLDNNEFQKIVQFGTSLYGLNKNGLYNISVDNFGDVTLTEVLFLTTASLESVTIHGDTLIVMGENFRTGLLYYVLDDSFIFVTALGSMIPTTDLIFDNKHWIGTNADGVVTLEDTVVTDFELGGLPHNNVSDIAVDSKGIVYGGFDVVSFAYSNGSYWTDFNFTLGQDATVTMVDSLDQIWMGTWGNGVWMYNGDSVVNYDEQNSTLLGNDDDAPNGLRWVYITGMDTDGRYVYLTSYRAENKYPIAIADIENLNSPTGWDSIGVSHGLSNTFLTSLDYDNGKVAVSTESDGIYVCSVGVNPFVDEKICWHLTRENSRLLSNSVGDIAYSPDGELWVGTNFGLSRFDLGVSDFEREIFVFRDVILPDELSSDITSLEFDSRGNLWIGTQNGLALRNPDDDSVEVFTTFNSGLASDFIKNITFDNFTGNIYVATDKGFSVISSLQGKPVFEVENVVAFPNPYVINSASDVLKFNFGLEAEVAIFSAVGEHIISMSANLSWDGKNDKGTNVASGVYLFIVKDANGNLGKGKILLVRN